MIRRSPTIIVLSDFGSHRFVALAEWAPGDRSVLSIRGDRDEALIDAGKAAVQWQAGPVVEHVLGQVPSALERQAATLVEPRGTIRG